MAPKVAVFDIHAVDLIVSGSVAVNHHGVRIGKGAGYSDIKVALLADAGLIRPHTTIVTTVHQLQVLGESLPHDEHAASQAFTCAVHLRAGGERQWSRAAPDPP